MTIQDQLYSFIHIITIQCWGQTASQKGHPTQPKPHPPSIYATACYNCISCDSITVITAENKIITSGKTCSEWSTQSTGCRVVGNFCRKGNQGSLELRAEGWKKLSQMWEMGLSGSREAGSRVQGSKAVASVFIFTLP